MRKRYLRFISGLSMDSKNLSERLRDFEAAQLDLIERMGGRTAALGALGDFPAPKSLDLSPWQGTVYNEMQTTAIQAGIIAGSSSKEAAQQMFRAGMDKSYRKLERLARTETTNAYWKNAWGSIADLPALVMVWGSEDGPRTCAWCRERDGLVMDGPGLRDHPNGRCTPIPTLRSDVQYRGSISIDGRIYHDRSWKKTQDARVTSQPTAPTEAKAAMAPKAVPSVAAPKPRVIKSVKDMDDFAKGMPAPSTLTKGAAQAMDDYAKGTAYTANAVLRGQKTYRGRPIDARTKAYTKKFTKEVDAMMDASTIPQDVRVVRAVQADAFGGIDELQKLVGGIYQDKGYMSTSLAEKVSSNIYNVKDAIDMEITVPKGTRALYMAGESYLRSERELLLDRGTRLAVQSVNYDERSKKWKLIATVVPGPR